MGGGTNILLARASDAQRLCRESRLPPNPVFQDSKSRLVGNFSSPDQP
jgi:hypothetical protein